VKHLIWCLFGLSCSTAVRAQALAPDDFAFGLPITTTQAAAAYRFPLPLAVYQNSFREDLGDLRLFNERGVAVPFSLFRPAEQTHIHKPEVALPMFPLHEGARVVIDGIRVTIDSPQSAIKLQTQNGGAAALSVSQYVLDARALNAAVSALRLSWPDTASDYSGRVRVEASDDLGSWHSVVVASPIANLHANGQTLIESRIAMTATTAKYFRISWLGSAPAFELTTVLAEPTDTIAEPEREVLEVLGSPDPVSTTDYLFDLGARPPVSRVNVLLPVANAIIDAELSSRRTSKDPWRFVTRAGLYRLKNPDAEQHNAAFEIGTDSDRYWRARISRGPTPPLMPLRLHVEWIPNQLTFLAQGDGPFLLAYGNANAVGAEADFSNIPSTLQVAPAVVGSPRVLGGSGRLAVKPAAFPWRRAVLWSVLLLAVILLAWMAYRVSKDSSPSAEPHDGT
jgi:Protein of unknown function (DUF3999)